MWLSRPFVVHFTSKHNFTIKCGCEHTQLWTSLSIDERTYSRGYEGENCPIGREVFLVRVLQRRNPNLAIPLMSRFHQNWYPDTYSPTTSTSPANQRNLIREHLCMGRILYHRRNGRMLSTTAHAPGGSDWLTVRHTHTRTLRKKSRL